MRSGIEMVVLIALVLGLGSTAIAATPAGEVLAVRRAVYVERAGEQSAARPAMPLMDQDAVMTDARARSKLYFRDDSILNLGELSRVEVEKYLYNDEANRSKAIYHLLRGSVRVVVGRSDLEIHTPTAVAAARGTQFIVSVEPCSDTTATPKGDQACSETRIYVLDGEVEIRNVAVGVGGSVTAHKGERTRVISDTAPEAASESSPAQVAHLSRATAVMGDLAVNAAVEGGANVAAQGLRGGNLAGSPEEIVQETRGLVIPSISQQPAETLAPVVIEINLPEGTAP